jgi:hypothetical protein
VLIVIQLQMRQIEVIRTRKSRMNKEFRNCVESKSFGVRNAKMPWTQFALIVNLSQMRQNKVSSISGKRYLGEWESWNQTTPTLDRNKSPVGWKGF